MTCLPYGKSPTRRGELPLAARVELAITVVGGAGADELRSLHAWLVREDELRGRVALVEPPPERGALGSIPEALAVALGPGGVATALAGVLVTWLRHRTTDLTLRAGRKDGATVVELSVRRMRDMDPAAVQQQVRTLSRLLAEAEETTLDGRRSPSD